MKTDSESRALKGMIFLNCFRLKRTFGFAGCVALTVLAFLSEPSGAQQSTPEILDEVTVSAARLPSEARQNPFSTTVVTEQQLKDSPSTLLDALLRKQIPGFSLFRRSDSRIAHPTAQGVTLRNLGPNGAGRTLVLLDGTPLNDPFAGWVPWQRIPLQSLEKVYVTKGGGAGLYGNAALGGTINLLSRAPSETMLQVSGLAGTNDTYEQSLRGAWQTGPLNFSGYAQHAETGGFPVIRADQRGPVDRHASSKIDHVQGRAVWQLNDTSHLEISGTAFSETRQNGTPLARNSTNGVDLAAAFVQQFPELNAEAKVQAYYQQREFASTFTSVNESRTMETPALDQFSVPARSAGGSFTWSQRLADVHQLVAGADFRWVEGETNERFRYMEGRFTRQREAGGEQNFAGVFVEDTWEMTKDVQLILGGRFDYVQQQDGRRRERERQTGDTLLRQEFDDRETAVPNGRLGINWQMNEQFRIRAAAYSGFREPTLNELYRPFRVGNEITEANANLEEERLLGLEAGIDWTPDKSWTFSLTGFYNQLKDAVGNVTIGRGPGEFEPGGFVPEGGVLRQRQNLERVDTAGVEAALSWTPSEAWSFGVQYLFSHARVEKSSRAPDLEGMRLEQSPEHVLTASLTWKPHAQWTLSAQTRFTGSQYEDDMNTLKLKSYATVDIGVGYQATRHLLLQLSLENLFNTTVETGKRDDGLVSIGAPFLAALRVQYDF